jgi:23S rRNA (cytidine1920-2'-O)/16S rRNA (cytidine1409-2'-O)-methyltransferase
MKSLRLDILLVERGLFASREEARTAIMDGAIIINGEKKEKPGIPVPVDAQVEIKRDYTAKKFASRGGLKLEKALMDFGIVSQNRICLDIGASTGGFTDCLLKQGALKVYAIDVGYGQLAWNLRNDSRVICLERVNARNLNESTLYKSGEPWATLAVVDVSFISLEKILGPCASVMQPEASEFICLIKPQFEVGREKVGKGGVVRSQLDHCAAIEKTIKAAHNINYHAVNLVHSPVKGPAGNIEFLIHLSKEEASHSMEVAGIVDAAHKALSDPRGSAG